MWLCYDVDSWSKQLGGIVHFTQWLLFVSSTVLISATPGPNMLWAFQSGLNHGLKKTMWALLGLSAGLVLVLGLSLAGVALLSQQSPLAFEIFKCLGALYLAYLGYRSWHSDGDNLNVAAGEKITPSAWQLFRTSLAVSLSNPKAILFFAAFFPKFIQSDAPQIPQYGILIATFFVIEIVWQLLYSISGQALSSWLQQGRRLLWLNRSCAVVFVLIALSLLWDSFNTMF